MNVKQFLSTLTKPIEYVWDKIKGIEHRFENVIQDERAITPEFLASAKQMIAVGEEAFQKVTLAAAQRGENWTEDLAAKAAVEAFLPAFKDFSVEVSKAFEILEVDLEGQKSTAAATPAVETESDHATTTAAAEQVQQANQEENQEEQREDNADATLKAAENEAAAPANNEEKHDAA